MAFCYIPHKPLSNLAILAATCWQQSCTAPVVGLVGVRHKGILGGNDRLAQHSHLEVVVLQTCLAQTGNCPGVPFRCPHCLDGMPHVLPAGLPAIPFQACRRGEGGWDWGWGRRGVGRANHRWLNGHNTEDMFVVMP